MKNLPQKRLLVILICSLYGLLLSQDKIYRVQFIGLRKVKPDYLKQFIEIRKGSILDTSTIKKDLQNLNNLQLFSDVSYQIQKTDTGRVVIFKLDEVLTFLPIGNLGGITGNFWFQIGAADYNWLGRGNTLGGYYRYYDRHSFEFFLKMPFLFKHRWGLSSNINRIATIEPTEIQQKHIEYNVDRFTFTALLRYNFSYNLFIEFGGGYLFEKYEKNIQRSGEGAPGPQLKKYDKYLIKSALTLDHIDYFYHYLSGFSEAFTLETVKTRGEKLLFWKVLNIAKWFYRPTEKGNIAVRLRMGAADNRISPFVPFVLDSYITVRGSGNRVTRGTAELTVNTEYRYSVFQSERFTVQGIGFVDWSAWRPPGDNFSGMIERENNVTFSGIGIRFHLRKIYNLILRLDYGINVIDLDQHGFVFGSGQYF